MFTDSVILRNKTQSAVAEINQLAVTSPQTFRKVGGSDNGRVTRTNNLLGEYVVSRTSTKEYGNGGTRTLIRFNLKQNGSGLPGASAHLVLTSAPGIQGPTRAAEALGLLLSLLFTHAVQEGDAVDTPVTLANDGVLAGFPKVDLTSDVGEILYEDSMSNMVVPYVLRAISGEA